ncbi:hypothetical protein M422DRAFT_777063 [Sphaerobolus stellatus SS14]|nr:hypothetical protein M422DRAFT_777063 [Sphaerobolus stellatus SS14]
MKAYGLYEPSSVKRVQTLKTAIEAARVLLRVDDIVQAKRGRGGGGGGGEEQQQMQEEMEAQ